MTAKIIAQQLGIKCFSLLGAHTLVDLGDGLQFRFEGCEHINLIQIILAPSDTYTVKFVYLEKKREQDFGVWVTFMEWSQVSSHEDVYCDMLHDLIEQETGVKTRLV